MRVEDAMTRTVRAVTADQSVGATARVLLDWGVSGLPVVDKDMTVVGVITEGDLLRRPESGTTKRRGWLQMLFASGTELANEYIKTHAVQVRDAMTTPAITIEKRAPLADAADLMVKKGVKRLPVVEAGRLVGMLSRSDVFRTWARIHRDPTAAPSDSAIRGKLLDAIDQQPWVGACRVNATVENGKVELWGMVNGEAEKRALDLLAERQPGVKAVVSHVAARPPSMAVGD